MVKKLSTNKPILGTWSIENNEPLATCRAWTSRRNHLHHHASSTAVSSWAPLLGGLDVTAIKREGLRSIEQSDMWRAKHPTCDALGSMLARSELPAVRLEVRRV